MVEVLAAVIAGMAAFFTAPAISSFASSRASQLANKQYAESSRRLGQMRGGGEESDREA